MKPIRGAHAAWLSLALSCFLPACGGSDDSAEETPDAMVADEPDMMPVRRPVDDACGGATMYFFDIDGQADGDAITVSAELDAANSYQGTCLQDDGTHEAVVRFEAPAAGFYEFSAAGTGYPVALYAIGGCINRLNELDCSVGGDDPAVIQLELDADDRAYVVVDALADPGGQPFTLTVRPVEAVAPSIDDYRVVVDRDRGFFGVRAVGSDANADVTEFRLELYDQMEALIPLTMEGALDEEVDASILADNSSWRPDGADFVFEFFLFVNDPAALDGIAKATLLMRDATGRESEAATGNPMRAPVVERDGACDTRRFFDVCSVEDACLGEEGAVDGTCQQSTTPVLLTVEAFKDPQRRLIGIRVEGTDPEENVVGVTLVPLDEDGTERELDPNTPVVSFPFTQVDSDAGNYAARGGWPVRFWDACLPPAQMEFQTCMMDLDDQEVCAQRAFAVLDACSIEELEEVPMVRVGVYDDTGKVSITQDVPLNPVPTVEDGDLCDLSEATTRCPRGTACYTLEGGASPVCQDPVVECPAGWQQIPLNDFMSGISWLYEGAAGDAALQGGPGTCAGGGPQIIHRYTAPRDGEYRISVSNIPDGVNPSLFVRTHCAPSSADFELACNEDADTTNVAPTLLADLEEDQEVFIIVDFGRANVLGTYTLTVSQRQ